MDPRPLITSLAASRELFPALVAGLDDTALRWRPAAGKWSLLELLCHLGDEEREDFRQRLRLTLTKPGAPWPGIDPEAWVSQRNYAGRDPQEALAEFLRERADSLEWLNSLEDVDWEREYTHPALGVLRAGDLLTSWAAHDLLHVRQAAGIRLAYMKEKAAPYSPKYAGG